MDFRCYLDCEYSLMSEASELLNDHSFLSPLSHVGLS
jgi:hypothetical protein